jgi:hypothetical protein
MADKKKVKCGTCVNHQEYFIREGEIVFGGYAHGVNACICSIDRMIRDPDVEKECPHDVHSAIGMVV